MPPQHKQRSLASNLSASAVEYPVKDELDMDTTALLDLGSEHSTSLPSEAKSSGSSNTFIRRFTNNNSRGDNHRSLFEKQRHVLETHLSIKKLRGFARGKTFPTFTRNKQVAALHSFVKSPKERRRSLSPVPPPKRTRPKRRDSYPPPVFTKEQITRDSLPPPPPPPPPKSTPSNKTIRRRLLPFSSPIIGEEVVRRRGGGGGESNMETPRTTPKSPFLRRPAVGGGGGGGGGEPDNQKGRANRRGGDVETPRGKIPFVRRDGEAKRCRRGDIEIGGTKGPHRRVMIPNLGEERKAIATAAANIGKSFRRVRLPGSGGGGGGDNNDRTTVAPSPRLARHSKKNQEHGHFHVPLLDRFFFRSQENGNGGRRPMSDRSSTRSLRMVAAETVVPGSHPMEQGLSYNLYKTAQVELCMISFYFLAPDFWSKLACLIWFALPPAVVFPIYSKLHDYVTPMWDFICESQRFPEYVHRPLKYLREWIRCDDARGCEPKKTTVRRSKHERMSANRKDASISQECIIFELSEES
eukprot:CAMPEP_0116846314 /NCGR_PEP_ID=MMETSP0418-20121206/13763_1 /TAXON_ID=1158023 /ORGANISM="Astrosyne radiata, Strain 13vi08-1A" /LENGTH=524 /DNA_ID=CAMNT_0004477541 /DNA_START=113 /DNA_END=1687 /DNA_ORIENTATION=+